MTACSRVSRRSDRTRRRQDLVEYVNRVQPAEIAVALTSRYLPPVERLLLPLGVPARQIRGRPGEL